MTAANAKAAPPFTTLGLCAVRGQVPSKSNLYRVVTIRGRGALAKTKALTAYEASFWRQCAWRDAGVSRPFRLDVDVFFTSDRPDLDNALKAVLDCLQQCGAIRNDRLCAEIRARKFVDKADPRVEMRLATLVAPMDEPEAAQDQE